MTEKPQVLGRREFLKASALLGAGLVAAQCAAPPMPTEAPKAEAIATPTVLKGTTINGLVFLRPGQLPKVVQVYRR